MSISFYRVGGFQGNIGLISLGSEKKGYLHVHSKLDVMEYPFKELSLEYNR